MGNTLQNTFESIFMESNSPRRSGRQILHIKYTIQNGIETRDKETPENAKKILDIIPCKINFTIKNNIAISTKDSSWVDNNKPISELLCCEGLNRTHYVSLSREQHYLIAKVNLNTSSSQAPRRQAPSRQAQFQAQTTRVVVQTLSKNQYLIP